MSLTVAIILAAIFGCLSLASYLALTGGSDAIETHSDRLASSTESTLRGLFLFADSRRLVALYAAAIVVVPTAFLLSGLSWISAVLALAGVVMAPRHVLQRMAERRRRVINQSLPDALAQIAGAMRAGATFANAIQSMVDENKGPLGQEFGLLLRELRVGARLDEALDNLGERVQSEEMDLVISAALIAQEVGGNLAEILQRLSETIRRKLEMEGKIRALTSQGVLQGRVVTALPFLILLALLFLEPEATRPIFSSVLGWCFLTVILVLQIIGGLAIRRIVRIEI